MALARPRIRLCKSFTIPQGKKDGRKIVFYIRNAQKFRPVSPSLSSNKFLGAFWGEQMLAQNYTTWHYSVMVLYPIRDVLWCWWPLYNPPGSVEDPRISIRSWSTFPKALPPNSQVTTLQTHPKNPSTPSQLLPTRRKRVTCKSLATTSAFFGRGEMVSLPCGLDWASQKKTIQGMREKISLFETDTPITAGLKGQFHQSSKVPHFCAERRGRW